VLCLHKNLEEQAMATRRINSTAAADRDDNITEITDAVKEKFGNANWRNAAMVGAFGAAAVLFFTGKRSAALAAAGIGLAALASEHPDKFQDIWEHAPEYLERGTRLVNSLGQFVERLAEQGERIQQARGRMSHNDYMA
jgi:hypothetical protein